MYLKHFTLLLLLSCYRLLFSQTVFEGVVLEQNTKTPLVGLSVYTTDKKVGATTDNLGVFSIVLPDTLNRIVLSYIGYKNDTISYSKRKNIYYLLSDLDLKEVQISKERQSSFVSKISTIHQETLTEASLQKAACCNIAESFETNASVDMLVADAVTGSKKIQLLGLDGIYTQIQQENIPLIRGISSAFGLSYIPGTWAKSIQIKKGAGSVVNGFESIAGQINIEFKKPEEKEQFFFNAYTNHRGRIEANTNFTIPVNQKTNTLTAIHYSKQLKSIDVNEDTFVDIPEKQNISFLNRWKWKTKKSIHQVGIRATDNQLISGQNSESTTLNPYKINVNNQIIELYNKNGFLLPNHPTKSIGIITNINYQKLQNIYGSRTGNFKQHSGTVNGIFESKINPKNTIKTGVSFQIDDFNKEIDTSFQKFMEIVPGIFGEYTYNDQLINSLVIGARIDYHSIFGLFFTPRIHYKRNLSESASLRFSVGKGYRTSHPFVESTLLWVNNRTIYSDYLPVQESAWNTGGSFIKEFQLFNNNASIVLDYFATLFTKKQVIDIETPYQANIYLSKKENFIQSTQIEATTSPTNWMTLALAYKYYTSTIYYQNSTTDLPLSPRHRTHGNIELQSNNKKWSLDYTAHYLAKSRIPNTTNKTSNQWSPGYFQFNSQLTYKLKNFDCYAGVENITGYRQINPIINPQNPFAPDFDASLIWGPTMGRVIYLGIRYQLKKQ